MEEVKESVSSDVSSAENLADTLKHNKPKTVSTSAKNLIAFEKRKQQNEPKQKQAEKKRKIDQQHSKAQANIHVSERTRKAQEMVTRSGKKFHDLAPISEVARTGIDSAHFEDLETAFDDTLGVERVSAELSAAVSVQQTQGGNLESKDSTSTKPEAMLSLNDASAVSPQHGLTNTNGHTDPDLKETPAPPPLVSAHFPVREVQPFPRPTTLDAKSNECIFFLSHRGPDTKEDLVRPLSFLLRKLHIPHFFDQSDESMQLGKVKTDQMAQAAWCCIVGVVILSDKFADSKWCLRELNTFLLRRHQDPSKAVLLPVYLSESSRLDWKVFGEITSVIRPNNRSPFDFLLGKKNLVTRLLDAPDIQGMSSVKTAKEILQNEPLILARWWLEFLSSDPQKRIDIPAEVQALLSVYVPVKFSLTPPSVMTQASKSDEKQALFDLGSLVQDLLAGKTLKLGRSDREPKILLLQGLPGAGKTLFGWYLFQEYTKSPESALRMPFFISLPIYSELILSSDASRLLRSFFERAFHISEADSAKLEALPFIFFLDGFDEIGLKSNLCRKCELHRWYNSTFIITCRSQVFTEIEANEYLTPVDPSNDKPVFNQLVSLYLLPFDERQVFQFVSMFAEKYQSLHNWKPEQYHAALAASPQVKEFLKEPLLLFMVLNVLPRFELRSSNPAVRSRRLNPRLLEVTPLDKIDWVFPNFRRAELYALFMQCWVEREIQRLRQDQRPSVEKTKSFCKKIISFCDTLAFQMFLHDRTLTTVHSLLSMHIEDLTLEEQLELKNQDQWAAQLFQNHGIERACTPLRQSASNQFSFLHKSFQEYFAAHQIAYQLSEKILLDNNWLDPKSIAQLFISKKRVTTDYGVIRFAADLVDQRVHSYRSPLFDSKSQDEQQFQPFGRALFDLIQANCHPFASSNAMTILNAAGVDFASRNFPNLDLSSDLIDSKEASVEFLAADLSAANLFRCNLSGAKLYQVRLECACLDEADLRDGDLRNTAFGQSPTFGCTSNDCALVLSSDGKAMFSGSDDNIIRQWSIDTGLLVRSLTGHHGRVLSLALSSDGRSLFSGSTDKTETYIYKWSLDNGMCSLVFTSHTDVAPLCMVLDVGKRTLYTGSTDSSITQWSIETSKSLFFLSHSDPVSCLALSSDGQILWSASTDSLSGRSTVFRSSLNGDRVTFRRTNSIRCLALSPDDRFFFSGFQNCTIWQCSAATGDLVREFVETGLVSSLILSFDGRVLFSAADNVVRQWAVDSGPLVRLCEGHSAHVTFLASSDRRYLFSTSPDLSIRQWSLETHSLIRIFDCTVESECIIFGDTNRLPPSTITHLQDIQQGVSQLALSSDGNLLSAQSLNGTIRQWSLNTGQFLNKIDYFPPDSTFFSQFSPSDQKICGFSTSGRRIFHHLPESCGTLLWSSGPWSLSATGCRLNARTQLETRSRLLLTQHGAVDDSR